MILTLSGIYHYDLADRGLIQDGFDSLLDSLEDMLLLEALMHEIAALKMHDLLPKVWKLLRTGPLRKKLSKLDIQDSFESGWQEGLTLNASPGTRIQNPREDVAALIQSWHYFIPPMELDPEELRHPLIAQMLAHENAVSDRTGRPTPFILYKRNLPCTCGSGLPYGACCVKK